MRRYVIGASGGSNESNERRAVSRTQIRVASVPAGHPYVRHLADPDGSRSVRRLGDPAPSVPRASPGQWWPPLMLEPDWLEEHHDEFDLMHVHFGFDEADPKALLRWVALLTEYHIPLVVTVHDLVNPHFLDSARHLAQLEVLVAGAAGLITLTSSAAAEIRSRWGRQATVIPHPHIVPLDRIGRTRPDRRGFVIGVHAKSLRANIDPVPVLTELATVLPELPGCMLRVDVHPDVFGSGAAESPVAVESRAAALREWLGTAEGHSQIQVVVRPRLDDDQLWDYLRSIDLCVLPYRFGTHSGWLEACVDLGTGVLVPTTGHYADQHGHPTYGPGVEGLAAAVRSIYDSPDRARPTVPDRREQRRRIAAAHELVYRDVLAGRASLIERIDRQAAPHVLPAVGVFAR